MQIINFDQDGFLIGKTPILLSKTMVESTFCFNPHRLTLWEQYVNFEAELLEILDNTVEKIGIDGSFIAKKSQPNDIDILLFLPFDTYELNEAIITNLIQKYTQNLDIYIVKYYPKAHKYYIRTQFDTTEWLYLFSKKRNAKGSKTFVQLQ
ncbi:MAG: hypothetical protein RI894_5 [Bacteroidota bacterium]|jgi:hypothetical protein